MRAVIWWKRAGPRQKAICEEISTNIMYREKAYLLDGCSVVRVGGRAMLRTIAGGRCTRHRQRWASTQQNPRLLIPALWSTAWCTGKSVSEGYASPAIWDQNIATNKAVPDRLARLSCQTYLFHDINACGTYDSCVLNLKLEISKLSIINSI